MSMFLFCRVVIQLELKAGKQKNRVAKSYTTNH